MAGGEAAAGRGIMIFMPGAGKKFDFRRQSFLMLTVNF
jgi:hypothetical protein